MISKCHHFLDGYYDFNNCPYPNNHTQHRQEVAFAATVCPIESGNCGNFSVSALSRKFPFTLKTFQNHVPQSPLLMDYVQEKSERLRELTLHTCTNQDSQLPCVHAQSWSASDCFLNACSVSSQAIHEKLSQSPHLFTIKTKSQTDFLLSIVTGSFANSHQRNSPKAAITDHSCLKANRISAALHAGDQPTPTASPKAAITKNRGVIAAFPQPPSTPMVPPINRVCERFN